MIPWKLKRVSWFVVLPLLVVAVVVCLGCYQQDNAQLASMGREAAQLQDERSVYQSKTEKRRTEMKNVGTTAQLESEARKQNFIKEGELLFEVVNTDLLDNYTEEEWNILMEERTLNQE